MKTSIFSQHQEHETWMNKLAFYDDEILIMQKRIGEIASKNTGKEILASVEHFQNQLIIQKKHIDDMRHRIRQHEKELEHNVDANPVASDHRKVEDHSDDRDFIEGFELNINKIRTELNAFLSQRM